MKKEEMKELRTELEEHKIDEKDLDKVSGGGATAVQKATLDAKHYGGGLKKKIKTK